MKTKLDHFTQAYIEAIYFTEGGPDNPEFDEAALSAEAMDQIKADCAKFHALADGLICGQCNLGGDCTDGEKAAHDFWLTRNGHGSGFWDGDWPNTGDKLTAIAKQCGEVWAYIGDDGLIYLSR